MKKLIFLAFVIGLASCGSGKPKIEDIYGSWKLTSYEEGEENPFRKNMGEFSITDCDKSSVWNFLAEDDEPLSDGTEVKKLIVEAGEGCKFYDFESKWSLRNGEIFLTATSLGGIGGRSYAGLFKISSFSPEAMVLEISDARLGFIKEK